VAQVCKTITLSLARVRVLQLYARDVSTLVHAACNSVIRMLACIYMYIYIYPGHTDALIYINKRAIQANICMCVPRVHP